MRHTGDTPLDTAAVPGRVRAKAARRPTVLEICAGAGGEALGLEAAGFDHLGLVEVDNDAVATLEANRPEWPVIHENLRGLDLRAYEGVDLLAGGVPCQPYSSAGNRRGAHDERDLFPEALRLVRELRPKAVLLENVTGVLHVSNSVNRLRILSQFASLGYDAEWRILNGVDFGLPQKRRRAILVAFRPGTMHRFRWPEPIGIKAPAVGEALRDLMGKEGWRHVDGWVERANGYAPTLIGGSQKKKGIDLARENSRKSWLDIGVNPSGKANKAPGSDTPADYTPRLTLQMMARIQGFPDYWEFQGDDLQVFHQIANAFPPCMAHAVGASIMRALTGSEIDLQAALTTPKRKPGRLNLAALRSRPLPEELDEFA
jgi:DNA (cytosine-5)-methyltransferase 1